MSNARVEEEHERLRQAVSWVQQLVTKEFDATLFSSTRSATNSPRKPPNGVPQKSCDAIVPLQDGSMLCCLINLIEEGKIRRIHWEASVRFKRLQNVTSFVDACRDFGVNERSLIAPSDLLDGKAPYKVSDTLYALAALPQARKLSPSLLPPPRRRTIFWKHSPKSQAAIASRNFNAAGSPSPSPTSSPSPPAEELASPVYLDSNVSTVKKPEPADEDEGVSTSINHDAVPKDSPSTTPQPTVDDNIQEQEPSLQGDPSMCSSGSSHMTSDDESDQKIVLSSPSGSDNELERLQDNMANIEVDDDDDNWSTDPDYEATKIDRSIKHLRPADEHENDSEAATVSGSAVFGVMRGKCLEPDCDCHKYQMPEGGGACLNCGHYPVRHKNKSIEVDPVLTSIDLSKLQFGEIIGQGTFGKVYIARLDGTLVAVKKLIHQALDKSALADFRNEANIMKSIRHPHVVLFMGMVDKKHNYSIVTEFMDRGSLYAVLKKGGRDLTWPCLLKMALGAARGMAYLHSLQPPIIHRDLKSLNLLVDEHYTVKVTDFGLSKVKANAFNATRKQLGTTRWMAPEVLEGGHYDGGDQWGFGMILYELISRKLPYPDIGVESAIQDSIVSGILPELPWWCPEPYRDLCMNLWTREPSKRPNFTEIIDLLEDMESLEVELPADFYD